MDVGQRFILAGTASDSEVILAQKPRSTGNSRGCVCITTAAF